MRMERNRIRNGGQKRLLVDTSKAATTAIIFDMEGLANVLA